MISITIMALEAERRGSLFLLIQAEAASRLGLIQALGLMKSFLAALVVFASFGAPAADAFHYDHCLASDLAQAYLRSSHRQHPSFDVYADSANSAMSSAIAAHQRHLVFVTFAKSSGQAGSYVELELCAETNLLTVVDTGNVDNIRAYRADTMQVNSKIFVASPSVCPAEVP